MSRFIIDQRTDAHHGRDVWSVWEVASDGEPALLGEYDTVASAKASLDVEWRPPHYLEVVTWSYIADADEPNEDAYPHAASGH